MRRLLVVFLALLAWDAQAATYYVDTTCTDTNVGSATVDGTEYDPATPACTGGSDSYYVTIADLQAKVTAGFAAGDFIKFRRGQTWNGTNLDLTNSGSAGNPITVDAFGSGALPIISGAAYSIATNGDYITINNIHAKNNTQYGLYVISPSDHIIIDGVKVENIADPGYASGGVHLSQTSHSIIRNSIIDNTNIGIFVTTATSDNVLVDNNTVTTTRNHGISIANGITNAIVSNNTVSLCGAIDNDVGCIDYFDPGAGGVAKYNKAYNCGTADLQCFGIRVDGALAINPVTIQYNQAYGNSGGGISITGDGHFVYNNVTYQNTGYSGGSAELNFYQSADLDNTVNATVKNNIFYGASDYLFSAPANQTTGHTINYNLWYGGSATPFNWNGTDYNFADYKTNSSQDANSVNSDPLMTNPAGNVFTIQPTSPAINAGTSVSLTRDYRGRKVPIGSAPEIGAYEYPAGPASLLNSSQVSACLGGAGTRRDKIDAFYSSEGCSAGTLFDKEACYTALYSCSSGTYLDRWACVLGTNPTIIEINQAIRNNCGN